MQRTAFDPLEVEYIPARNAVVADDAVVLPRRARPAALVRVSARIEWHGLGLEGWGRRARSEVQQTGWRDRGEGLRLRRHGAVASGCDLVTGGRT